MCFSVSDFKCAHILQSTIIFIILCSHVRARPDCYGGEGRGQCTHVAFIAAVRLPMPQQPDKESANRSARNPVSSTRARIIQPSIHISRTPGTRKNSSSWCRERREQLPAR